MDSPYGNIVWASLGDDFENKKAQNGESLNEVRNRAEKFIELLKNLKYERIAVVSHSTFIRIFFSIVMKKSMKEVIMGFHLEPCSISRINQGDVFSVDHFAGVVRTD